VSDQAIRVRELPAREGVGAEALVDEPERAFAQRVAQVVVEAADLVREQQALVDHRAAREARHVEVGDLRQPVLVGQLLERVLGLLADHDQLALERVLVGAVVAAADERLADHRHRGEHCLAEPVLGGRHVAPADQVLALLGDELLELAADELARLVVLRQEAHGDRVVARRRQRQPGAFRPLAVERVGDLQQDAGAVAEQRVGADRAAVVEVGKDLERLRDDPVRLRSLDVGDKAHTARVMLVARIVQALRRGILVQHSLVPVTARTKRAPRPSNRQRGANHPALGASNCREASP
jgi:hypothetical protein